MGHHHHHHGHHHHRPHRHGRREFLRRTLIGSLICTLGEPFTGLLGARAQEPVVDRLEPQQAL